MPDLTIEIMSMCASIDGPITKQIGDYTVVGLFSDRLMPFCSCPAFKYSKASNKTCKHIQQAEAEVCGWHEQWGDPQEKEDICPKCGGPTVYVKVAV